MTEQSSGGPFSYSYPRPALTADCIVFGFGGDGLQVLLIERKNDPHAGSWALPGGFVDMDETAATGALRELQEETAVSGIELRQLGLFSTVDRDPRQRTVSVAYWGGVEVDQANAAPGDDASKAQWFAVANAPPLAFDHREMLDGALGALREFLRRNPIESDWLDHREGTVGIRQIYAFVFGIEECGARANEVMDYLARKGLTAYDEHFARARDRALEGGFFVHL